MPSKQASLIPRFSTQAWKEIRVFFLGSKLNILLVSIPLATVSKIIGWSDGWTCALSMIALCPLAERLGYVTEELAEYTNDSVGGLLNATFGNATELIVSIFALKSHLLRVVQLSLLGSVISNLLLVMGTAFLVGGVTRTTQTFSSSTISVHCCLLLLACVAVLLPTVMVASGTEASNMAPVSNGLASLTESTDPDQLSPSPPPSQAPIGPSSSLTFSRVESILMLIAYLAFLIFQLHTHKHLFEDDDEDDKDSRHKEGEDETTRLLSMAPSTTMHDHSNDMPTLENLQRKSKRSSVGISVNKTPDIPPAPGSFANFRSKSLNRYSHARKPSDSSEIELTEVPGNGSLASLSMPLGLYSIKPSSSALTLSAYHNKDPNETNRLSRGGAADQHSPLMRPSTDEELGLLTHRDGRAALAAEEEEEEDDKEGPQLSWPGALFWITLVTVSISLLSQWIVDAIEGASKDLKIPLPFLATILLPIVGNAAEHASAVIFAARNRMELALGICVGSSTQVSMLLLPLSVILAWTMGEGLSLDMGTFEAGVLLSTVLLASIMLADGSSNWLKGLALLFCYAFISAGFWFHGDLLLNAESNKQQA